MIFFFEEREQICRQHRRVSTKIDFVQNPDSEKNKVFISSEISEQTRKSCNIRVRNNVKYKRVNNHFGGSSISPGVKKLP